MAELSRIYVNIYVLHFLSFSNVGNSLRLCASTSNSSNTSSSSNEDEIIKDSCFEYFKRESKGRNYVRCNLCHKQKATAKAFRNSKRIPAICTLEGTIPRKVIFIHHLESEMHKKAVEAKKISHFSSPEKVGKTQLGSIINKSNARLKNKVAGLMINLFNDAKKLTLSAWSWPSREVANMMSIAVDHNNFLSCIVLADKTRINAKIENSLALSLRCDSSVDRRRIDNCHVLANIIDQDGKPELLFLGLDEPKARGTPGYVQAVNDAVNLTSSWSDVASKMTFIVTDRTNLNTGDKTSLWASLTLERKAYGLPLLMVWCIAHRTDLAWKAVSNNVSRGEVSFLYNSCNCIIFPFLRSSI
ncbi:Hypothetical predicted protein [Paramuricea clavata]|uniref:Uncharacterized protein n=1 Tax=Paramuricea clavata TaxID=317549 RepID=A0A7D9DA64_PARCT|nr:Hypothetical predicted protein [Paramuricea clavata]